MRALGNLGIIYYYQGEYGKAEEHLRWAMDAANRLGGSLISQNIEVIVYLTSLLYETWQEEEATSLEALYADLLSSYFAPQSRTRRSRRNRSS